MKFTAITAVVLLVLFSAGCQKDKESKKGDFSEILTTRVRGIAYLEENRLDEAEATFRELIEIAPDEASGYANLGVVLLRKSEYQEALDQLENAMEIEPENPDIRLILAKAYELNAQKDRALAELERNLEIAPDHEKTLYNLSELYARSMDENSLQLRENYLTSLVEIVPANIVPRLQLVELLLRRDQPDEALKHLEEVRRNYPELPKESDEFYNKTVGLLQDSNTKEALPQAQIFHNFLKVTSLYQADIRDLEGPGNEVAGFPVVTFSQPFLSQVEEGESILDAMKFVDVSGEEGLTFPVSDTGTEFPVPSHIATGDIDGDGDPDLYIGNYDPYQDAFIPHLLKNNWAGQGGSFEESSSAMGIDHNGNESAAIFADYDNDGNLDLYIVREGENILYRNSGNETFTNVTDESNTGDPGIGYTVLFFDLDHEGDLDLFIGKTGNNILLRNNSDGTFEEQSAEMKVAGKVVNTRDADIGDFDDDGDIDFFVVNEDGESILYSNFRQGRFDDVTEASGISGNGGAGAVTAGDYNNDGFLDLFITGREGGSHQLYKNKGEAFFEEDDQPWLDQLGGSSATDAKFFDFDNDGFLDIIIAGPGSTDNPGVRLFHNNGAGQFEETSGLLPEDLTSGRQVITADYDRDGDMDIFVAGINGGVRLLKNEGGNTNHYLKIQLVGLRSGSGKNNHFGIGAKLEIRAGDLYQMKVVTDPSVHVGLGHRLKADVVRILWTNGVPQNMFYPGSDQDLVEEQVLKGSCFFLYTWNGEKYVFAKDMMWRSAIGMPLGIMGATTQYAFPDISKEYLKIPGEMLKPKDGIYSLKVTEELWETAYFEKTELVVVDHPSSLDIFVDEGFILPPFPPLQIYTVEDKILPVSARDGNGNDLLPHLVRKDDRYVSNFNHDKYQGITEMKDLILDPGKDIDPDNLLLFMNGWVFPTDASINVSISQSTATRTVSPQLQVINKNGQWKTVIKDLGFPMGKDKTIVTDLSGIFLTDDYRIRIRTNMEIYWDHVFFSPKEEDSKVRTSTLKPDVADLHYRGFSKMYRKGGRYGPHWFDYYDVSKTQKWRDLLGSYTRYGDIRPLLLEGDDKYAIVNSGDEVSLEFSARQLPELPEGWSRDFLIYSEGWIKDGDLNTATGKTVEPLPFRDMSRYPYGKDEAFPSGPEYRKFLEKYQTRTVTTEEFRNAIRDYDPNGE